MTTESQTELYMPVRSGFGVNAAGDLDAETLDHHNRRNMRAQEEWARSPFVTNAKIKDASITSAKIQSLEADKITAGTLTANITVTGMLSVPATTGWRVEIGNPLFPLLYWDGTTTRFRLDQAGNVSITGAINATSGTVTGNMLVTGLIQSPSTSGYRIEIGELHVPLRYWDGATTKFAVDTLGNVAASDLTVTQSTSALTGIRVRGATNSDASQPSIAVLNSSNQPLFTVRNDGNILFGTGASGGGTYNILRGQSAGQGVVCQGQITGNQGVVTFIGTGGGMGDGDFAGGISPANGTLALTNNNGVQKLHARLAGTWYQVGLS